MESESLSGWLMGPPPSRSAPIGYQASKNLQDWLMAYDDSEVRDDSYVLKLRLPVGVCGV